MFKFLDIPPDLKEGDIAPDFELHDSQGKAFKLYEILSHKWVVIFFYPKDETPGCTAQACSFRNAYQEFKALGVEVLGISGDSAESHERFAQKQQLPYPLLSDPQGKVAKAFGVKKALGILPGRVTFVIDRDRRIQLAYSAQLQAESHQEKALEILKTKFATPQ
jgi:peroxiredoxin Q/BCP